MNMTPYAKLKNIPIGDCRWTQGFWADKFRLCKEVMVPHMGTLLKGDIGHAYNNFKIAAGLKTGEHRGMFWHDGDFYKWMEAGIYVGAHHADRQIIDELDEVIDVIAKAQEADGYLSTPIQIKKLPRFSDVTHHELYNSGHLLTTAAVHHRVTRKTNMLAIATKHADYLYSVFQPRPEGLERFGFNPSQIMGLVDLFRVTENQKYLELAEVFIDMRGSVPVAPHPTVPYWFIGDQCQMRTPLREETEAVGHAVLAMYLYAGAADVYTETGDETLLPALERIWSSAVERKMYVTGALGQVHHGARGRYDMIHEGFIDDYMLPNSTAYNETCANIANAMFNWRMLSITGDAKYGDVVELVLYNSALSGISADGKHYFYANPLRMNFGARQYTDDESCTESPDRKPYLECFCCPPNLVRTIASLSGWAYSLHEKGIAVHLYGGNQLNSRLLDGSPIQLTQQSNYPWDETSTIRIEQCREERFELWLRIPGWTEKYTVLVNGEPLGAQAKAGTYLKIDRSWKAGDVVQLTMSMPIELIEGHPRIEEVRNQVAVKRGPVVYCLESPDLPPGCDILDAYLPRDSNLQVAHDPRLLGGISTIKGQLLLRQADGTGLYRKLGNPGWKPYSATLVPYYAWSNRGMAEMTVFLPLVWQTMTASHNSNKNNAQQ